MMHILIGIAGAVVGLVGLAALMSLPAIAIAHFGWGDHPPLPVKLPLPFPPDSGGSGAYVAYGMGGEAFDSRYWFEDH